MIESGSDGPTPAVRAKRLVRILSLLLVGCTLAAIVVQEATGALPMGVQNQGRRIWELLAAATFGATALAALVLFADLLGWGRRIGVRRVAGGLHGGIIAYVILELCLAALDATVVSRGPDAWLGGPYQEIRGPDGEWTTFKKAHRTSSMGFRTTREWARDGADLRVLFLGDSYTEGSGRSFACNYPEVAAARLGAILGSPVEVLNAGVAGHGPDDSRRVLRHLVESGYRFDAIVHGLFLENDFTDNLPATDRRVMGGILFRVPSSFFLRVFHPLNGRTAHWMLLIVGLWQGTSGDGAVVHRDTGDCKLETAPRDAEPLAWTDAHMRGRFETNYGPNPRIAADEVARSLDEISQEADRLGVPLVRVVFPDRILVDPDSRRRLGLALDAPGFDPERLIRLLRALPGDRIELHGALAAGSENFAQDTHLSDLGNVRAGETVGKELARILKAHTSRP